MKPDKILKIIEEKEIFTVKDDNERLLSIIEKMEDQKLVQRKDYVKGYNYYGKADGRLWTLKNGWEST